MKSVKNDRIHVTLAEQQTKWWEERSKIHSDFKNCYNKVGRFKKKQLYEFNWVNLNDEINTHADTRLLWDCSKYNISLHLMSSFGHKAFGTFLSHHVIWWFWWVKMKRCHPEDELMNENGGDVFLHFGKYLLVHRGWFSFSIPFLALGMCRPLESEWRFLTQQQRTNNFIYLPESCPKHSPLITRKGSWTPH